VAKVNFQDLLLNQGEKGLIGVGAIGLGGLLVWSVASAFGGPDSPTTVAGNMDKQAQRITNAVQSNTPGEIAPLPPWVIKDESFVALDARQHALLSPSFEPTTEPSKLRDQPIVLTPVPGSLGGGVRFDLVRAPMPAYDVRNDNGKITVGVLTSLKINANDNKTLSGFRNNLKQKAGSNNQPRPGMPAGGPGGAMGGMGPGGRGGAMGGGAMGGGAMGGGAMGGGGMGGQGGMGPGGMGGMGPGGRGGMGGMMGGMNAGDSRTETFVKYLTMEQFDKEANAVPAITVYPLRMLSVQMAFPLKQQFEEIRKALKLQSLSEAVAASGYNDPDGLFQGIEVERREQLPDGQFHRMGLLRSRTFLSHDDLQPQTRRRRGRRLCRVLHVPGLQEPPRRAESAPRGRPRQLRKRSRSTASPIRSRN